MLHMLVKVSDEKGLNELLETWVLADTKKLILKIIGDGQLLKS